MTTSTMVERVARAMDEAGHAYIRANERDARIGKMDGELYIGWADIPSSVFARAAIEAMMEPTEAMCAADAGTSTTDRLAWNRAMFRAMISEALNSPTPSKEPT